MVKSGECYYTGSREYRGRYFVDSSRPREIKNPEGIGFSIHAAVQH